eukprot:2345095-Pleurochrysis_carterae.AAC.2
MEGVFSDTGDAPVDHSAATPRSDSGSQPAHRPYAGSTNGYLCHPCCQRADALHGGDDVPAAGARTRQRLHGSRRQPLTHDPPKLHACSRAKVVSKPFLHRRPPSLPRWRVRRRLQASRRRHTRTGTP